MKRRFFEYMITPRWKIMETRLIDMRLNEVSAKDKKIVQELVRKVRAQLKKIKRLSLYVLIMYILIYFSFISAVLSFSNTFSYVGMYVKGLISFVGVPALVVIAFLLNRTIANRYEDTRLLIAELIAFKKK